MSTELQTKKSKYDEQAEKFLADTGTQLSWKVISYGKYFHDSKDSRLIWEFTLKRGDRSYTSKFGASLVSSYEALLGKKWEQGHRLTVYEVEEMSKQFRFGKRKLKYYEPSAYDLLSCLEKHEPEPDPTRWALECGYELKNTSIQTILDIHKSCVEQYQALCTLYNEQEMDVLREIN